MLFLPELTILGAGLALFAVSLGQFQPRTVKNITAYVLLISLVTTICSIGNNGTMFFGAFKVDLFTQIIKSIVVLGTFIIMLFSNPDAGVKKGTQPEYYLFMLMSVFGLMMLVSANELLAIFVSLELSSFTVYLMVAMRKNDTGALVNGTAQDSTGHGHAGIFCQTGQGMQSEAAMKYLLYGITASGLMLFGMSYIYGLTGSTELPVLAPALAKIFPAPVAVVAVLLILAGFFYKVALFPMQFWVPDVYEGAGNEATAFIATVPKVVGIALLIRIASLIPASGQEVTWVLGSCAVISMFYGNLAALVQKDMKRLLGYSGIAHAGFALLSVAMLGLYGFAIAMYYIIGYLLMTLACFLVICTLSRNGSNLQVSDMAGLYKRAPLLAITLACALFALAGIPPFVGFMGKFMVMVEVLHKGYLVFVVLATINTAIAIYYYLSIVRQAWCTDDKERPAATPSLLVNAAAFFLLITIIAMGVFANPVVNTLAAALSTTFS
ncbi:NADH-quinone oxidoreductase subunit N [Desulforhopalus vacuolatus]|uniref:NADH-quinone oxidoreductase subunit N n=1 Tax=Desulforhopalus vacuolatus TaxID=40414 RepID=UPI0019660B77|nr:NADH-quinone oxidoreductase subunit N [Desulforhopalus vacuolatus]MBM9518664.1 NADH-quinone oxidoreductase subunit N [Desulforhopalus vacuolatus]